MLSAMASATLVSRCGYVTGWPPSSAGALKPWRRGSLASSLGSPSPWHPRRPRHHRPAPAPSILCTSSSIRPAEEEEIEQRIGSEDGGGDYAGPTAAVAGAAEEEALCTVPSCPMPEFSTSSQSVTLLNPCKLCSSSSMDHRPLLVYAPGMDCTGQGIRYQLPRLIDAGYDVRCIYIPTTDRSSWEKLVHILIPLLKKEQVAAGHKCDITLVGESFGGPLALHLALSAPDVFSRLVLVNPATNFQKSNPLASILSGTGLLALFPEELYKIAQDILLPLMVNRERVRSQPQDILSPVDLVPAACAAWRFLLLNDSSGLTDENLNSIKIPTLVITSAKDNVLSAVEEGGRLQRLLPNAKRIILPHSGHTALLEDSVDLSLITEMHGFGVPKLSNGMPSSSVELSTLFQNENGNGKDRDEALDELGRFLAPWRMLTSPLVCGEENLPSPELKRPILFVGNHTMFGFYDTPLLFHELFLRGFRCRGLAHPGHWRTSVGRIFERYGHVKATKLAAYRLLKEGEHVLLFPGGVREVCKRKGEEYKLMWKSTADFVRMASRFQAIIVPFATLGGDDAYKILFDGDDIMQSPFAPVVQKLYSWLDISLDTVYPVTAFPGTNIPSLLAVPNIERIYLHFAKPIDTATFEESSGGREKYDRMYSLVKNRVEKAIDMLNEIRLNDQVYVYL